MKEEKRPKVAVILGSATDWPLVEEAIRVLSELGIEPLVEVASAHRTPERVSAVVRKAEGAGAEVFIAAAGYAAHLAGAVAAETILPVIALPLATSPLGGLDALVAATSMPPGVPVASVGINAARNAAIFAAEIIAPRHWRVREALQRLRKRMAERVLSGAESVKQKAREVLEGQKEGGE